MDVIFFKVGKSPIRKILRDRNLKILQSDVQPMDFRPDELRNVPKLIVLGTSVANQIMFFHELFGPPTKIIVLYEKFRPGVVRSTIEYFEEGKNNIKKLIDIVTQLFGEKDERSIHIDSTRSFTFTPRANQSL